MHKVYCRCGFCNPQNCGRVVLYIRGNAFLLEAEQETVHAWSRDHVAGNPCEKTSHRLVTHSVVFAPSQNENNHND